MPRLAPLCCSLPLFLLVTTGANCPDGDADAGPGTAGPVGWDELKEAYLDWYERCQGGETVGSGTLPFFYQMEPDYFGTGGLVGVSFRDIFTQILDAFEASPYIVLHEEQAAACVAAIESGGCDEEPVNAACEGAMDGIAVNGTSCSLDFECDSGLCFGAGEETCGECRDRAAEGDSCDPEIGSEQCEDGLYCDAGTQTCSAYGQLDESCGDADGPCLFTLSCIDGVCSPHPGLGEPCGDGGSCADDLECEYSEADQADRCLEPVPTPPTPEVGDACDADDATSCGTATSTGLVCLDGSCAAIELVGEGEACDGPSPSFAPSRRWCLYGYSRMRCDIPEGASEGICVPLPSVGDACYSYSRCRLDEAVCTTTVDSGNVCVAAPGEGEPCIDEEISVGVRCAYGLTCAGDVCSDIFSTNGDFTYDPEMCLSEG